MGKVVATYLVKITVREPDDAPPDAEISGPTVESLEARIKDAIENSTDSLFAHVSAERTDI
jgi:hypothetical protein